MQTYVILPELSDLQSK